MQKDYKNILTIPKEFANALNKYHPGLFDLWIKDMKFVRSNNTHGYESNEVQLESIRQMFNNDASYGSIIRESFNWDSTKHEELWFRLYKSIF